VTEFKSVRDIVDALGGPTSMARALNEGSGLELTKGNVANWSIRNNLPAQYDVALVGAARRAGLDIT